jgi:hypothetical protein
MLLLNTLWQQEYIPVTLHIGERIKPKYSLINMMWGAIAVGVSERASTLPQLSPPTQLMKTKFGSIEDFMAPNLDFAIFMNISLFS